MTTAAVGWLQHDERGSATALLHICVRLSEHRFLFFFACLGDTEVSALKSHYKCSH